MAKSIFRVRSAIRTLLSLSLLIVTSPATAKNPDYLSLHVRTASAPMDGARAVLEIRRALEAKYPSSYPCGEGWIAFKAQAPIPNYTANNRELTMRCASGTAHVLRFADIRSVYIFRSSVTKYVPVLEVAAKKTGLALFFPNEADARVAANAFYLLAHPDQLATPQTEPVFQAAVAAAKASGDRTEAQRRVQVQAEALLKMDRPSGAALLYRDALATSPDWSQGHYNLALVYGSLGFHSAAITEMRRYLYLDPNAFDARAAQDQIYGWETLVGTSGGL